MNVSAIIVTRGDVELGQILESLPAEWEKIVWNNSKPSVEVIDICEFTLPSIRDLSVYGRYAAIQHASHDLIYVQDDDCIVSDPQAIVDAFTNHWNMEKVVCNMPPEFRHDFYADHALVGFGACFHRDAPQRAFAKFEYEIGGQGAVSVLAMDADARQHFYRTCDIVFTALTPRVLVDVPKTNLWWAEDESRMYRQPQHVEERLRMLELVKKVRDEG